MSPTTLIISGIAVMAAVIVAYLAVVRYRQRMSGRSVGTFVPEKRDGRLFFKVPVAITSGGRWCRLLLTVEGAHTSTVDQSPRFALKRVAAAVGTPFSLTLRDGGGRIVHAETGSLGAFAAYLWSHAVERESVMEQGSHGEYRGTVTILEFLPKAPGHYSIDLEIIEGVRENEPGSSARWEVRNAKLTVMEDVVPFTRIVRYPHKRIVVDG